MEILKQTGEEKLQPIWVKAYSMVGCRDGARQIRLVGDCGVKLPRILPLGGAVRPKRVSDRFDHWQTKLVDGEASGWVLGFFRSHRRRRKHVSGGCVDRSVQMKLADDVFCGGVLDLPALSLRILGKRRVM